MKGRVSSVLYPFLSFQFLTGLLLTILTDIIHFSLYYPQSSLLPDTTRFSAGMAIFSLLLKPLSCFFAYQMYRERGGEYAFNLGRRPSLNRRPGFWSSVDGPGPHVLSHMAHHVLWPCRS